MTFRRYSTRSLQRGVCTTFRRNFDGRPHIQKLGERWVVCAGLRLRMGSPSGHRITYGPQYNAAYHYAWLRNYNERPER